MADSDGTEIAKVAGRSKRGSAPGERRGGRVKGTPNKATASLKDLARQYTEDALKALVEVMQTETGSARVAAANAILDRGYGKPTTVLAGDGDGGPIKTISEVLLRGPE